jgi:hypothetical protein
MANAMFDPGREGFLDGSIDWDTNDQRVMLAKSAYSFNAAHKFVSELSTLADNGRSAALSGKGVTNGVADAAGTTLTVTSAVACNALIVYQYNASDTAARLIAYIDGVSGLPMTPAASATVSITWGTDENKMFKL